MFQVKIKKGNQAQYFQGTHVQSTDLFTEGARPQLIGHRVEVCPQGLFLEIPRDGDRIFIMENGHTIEAFQWPPLTQEEKEAKRDARLARRDAFEFAAVGKG